MKAYLIAGALIAITAGAACAQPAPKARPDANGDGKLTSAEFQTGMAARKARAPEGKGKGGDGSKMFGRLDGNGDGSLDKGELGKMAERRFGRMDADGDGVLSATERQAGQGMMGGGR